MVLDCFVKRSFAELYHDRLLHRCLLRLSNMQPQQYVQPIYTSGVATAYLIVEASCGYSMYKRQRIFELPRLIFFLVYRFYNEIRFGIMIYYTIIIANIKFAAYDITLALIELYGVHVLHGVHKMNYSERVFPRGTDKQGIIGKKSVCFIDHQHSTIMSKIFRINRSSA